MSEPREQFRDDDFDEWAELSENGHKMQEDAREAVRRASTPGHPKSPDAPLDMLPSRKPIFVMLGFVAVVGLLVLAAYFLASRLTAPATPQASAPVTATEQAPAAATDNPPASLTGTERTPAAPAAPDEGAVVSGARIALRLAFAALLSSLLAFRPHRGLPVVERSPHVAQTQILLGVIAAALMMLVGDSLARAFGILAVASLARFRTNIRDPKETSVVLVCLGIGVASGLGKLELAVILGAFVWIMVWLLEYFEPAQVARALELTVTTRKVDETDEILREILARRQLPFELRQLDREDQQDPVGKLVYYVSMPSSASTDRLSEEVFASDPDNIDAIRWDQKKSQSYIYR
jgi:hypothetical protein